SRRRRRAEPRTPTTRLAVVRIATVTGSTSATATLSADLADRHRAMLERESAIAAEVIAERGYRTIEDADQLKPLGFSRTQWLTPGLLLPIWTPDGASPTAAFRPDLPRVSKRGGTVKYEWPPATGLRLDVPPRCRLQLPDPSWPLWLTEGIKK